MKKGKHCCLLSLVIHKHNSFYISFKTLSLNDWVVASRFLRDFITDTMSESKTLQYCKMAAGWVSNVDSIFLKTLRRKIIRKERMSFQQEKLKHSHFSVFFLSSALRLSRLKYQFELKRFSFEKLQSRKPFYHFFTTIIRWIFMFIYNP